jgi:hypothetical protein
LLQLVRLSTEHYQAIKRMYEASTYVAINDTAISKIYCNAKIYADMMDMPINNIDDYLWGVSKYYWKHFGYSILSSYSHVRGTYLMMGRTKPKRFNNVVVNRRNLDATYFHEVIYNGP